MSVWCQQRKSYLLANSVGVAERRLCDVTKMALLSHFTDHERANDTLKCKANFHGVVPMPAPLRFSRCANSLVEVRILILLIIFDMLGIQLDLNGSFIGLLVYRLIRRACTSALGERWMCPSVKSE